MSPASGLIAFALSRLREEVHLLALQPVPILLPVLYLFYFGFMVFRNLAFYRFLPGELLRDLGHELIPALPSRYHVLAELPMAALYITIALLALATLLPPPPGVQKPHIINMFRRYVAVLALGHTLRFLSYISTSLPGTAAHCAPAALAFISPPQPKTLAETLTRYAANPGSNCGDLIFSGHMLQAIVFGLLILRYGGAAFALRPQAASALSVAVAAVVALQAVLVIAARNHYTVDVIVACYTSPLLWYFYDTALHPHDVRIADVYRLTRSGRREGCDGKAKHQRGHSSSSTGSSLIPEEDRDLVCYSEDGLDLL